MKRIQTTAGIILGLAIGINSAQAQTDLEVEKKMYLDCVAVSLENPDISFTNATTWWQTGGGLPAHHCMALSLAELGHYAEAARELEIMADDMNRGFGWPFEGTVHPRDRGMLSAVYGQTANAWLLAGEVKKAITLFGFAIREVKLNSPENSVLLFDRARAQADLGNYEEALRDLTLAETMVPDNADILALKANAYRATRQYNLADNALKKAFKLDPGHRETMLERGYLKLDQGDEPGAREIWMEYLRLYPEGAGADGIRRFLEIRDIRVDDFPPEDESIPEEEG